MASTSKWALRTAILVLCAITSIKYTAAQTQLVSRDYFPADLEFKELQKVLSEESGDHITALAGIKDAPIFAEAGFLHYAGRSYLTETGSDLTIEVLTTKDQKAAYSLLTLLRNSGVVAGPPGEFFAASDNALVFTQGAFWVRIQGSSRADLYRRIAISVSNRIGPREHAIPPLVSRFPQVGLDTDTVRYFLGPRSLESYGTGILGTRTIFGPEMEIAQAHYNHSGQTGTLSLISFPTSQAAESYFDSVSRPDSAVSPGRASRMYAKRTGPTVGILEGAFDAAAANEILQPLKYTYSIRWIYDKNNRNTATVWGVPVGILGTVVRSLLLTALLCVTSLVLGVGLALFRVFLRGYAPNNFLDRPERTEMIRLRLNEATTHTASSSPQKGLNHNP